MKLVIDQNCLTSRSPLLSAHLATSSENIAVLTDTAVFEMLKGSNPIKGATIGFESLMDFPDQIVVTGGTGELIRREIDQQTAIQSPEDLKLTEDTRALLREFKKLKLGQRTDFPLEVAQIQKALSLATAQRIDHPMHKSSLVGGVAALKKHLSPKLLKAVREGRMTDELYCFIDQCAFTAFSGEMKSYGVPGEKIQGLYSDYSIGARLTMIYGLSFFGWLKTGGAESRAEAAATNDFLDADYVTISTYFDGVLSNDKLVNALYERTKIFFEYSPSGADHTGSE